MEQFFILQRLLKRTICGSTNKQIDGQCLKGLHNCFQYSICITKSEDPDDRRKPVTDVNE